MVDISYGDVSPRSPNLALDGRQPFESDMAVAVEERLDGEGENPFRLVVVGDSEWLTDPVVSRAQENLALGLNLVDWLAQEERLAEIRSKVIATRTLIFDSPAHRNIVQYINIAGVPLAFIALGMVRYFRRRSTSVRTYIREK